MIYSGVIQKSSEARCNISAQVLNRTAAARDLVNSAALLAMGKTAHVGTV